MKRTSGNRHRLSHVAVRSAACEDRAFRLVESDIAYMGVEYGCCLGCGRNDREGAWACCLCFGFQRERAAAAHLVPPPPPPPPLAVRDDRNSAPLRHVHAGLPHRLLRPATQRRSTGLLGIGNREGWWRTSAVEKLSAMT